MKISKFDLLRKIYLELAERFGAIDDPKLEKILSSWAISFSDMDRMLIEEPGLKSKMSSGLEQGLLDTYSMLSELSDVNRISALTAYKEVVIGNEPKYFERLQQKCDKILERGKIRNETEWHLIRIKVEEISIYTKNDKRIDEYQRIIDDFEGLSRD